MPLSANDQATSDAVPRGPRRRWMQVSLRTLLILVTLLSIGLAWFVSRGERQRRAVAALEKVGGVVFYDSPDFPLYERPPDWARWIPRDYFENAYAVDMSESEVTDAGLTHIQSLTCLEYLNLTATQVTDVGLARIQGLIRLKELDLTGTQVTDVGLAHIQGLTRLEQLDLTDTLVTDAGLAHLQRMDQLKELDLYDAQATDAGIAKLQRMLPTCEIWYSHTDGLSP